MDNYLMPQANVGAQLRLRVRALRQGHNASGTSGDLTEEDRRAVGWNAVRGPASVFSGLSQTHAGVPNQGRGVHGLM